MNLSIIIIGKNEGWRLEKCLSSVDQFIGEGDADQYEVIYVDSKSTDDSISIAKSHHVDKIAELTGTCNAALARNVGAKIATGDTYLFLDGDMEVRPGLLQTIVNDDHRLVYPFISGIENDVRYDNDWNYIDSRPRRHYVENVDSYEPTTGGLFIIDANQWHLMNGMDTRLDINEDHDLGIRMMRHGIKLCRKPRLWVNHHTRIPFLRPDYGRSAKFNALVVRKHLFSLKAQAVLFKSQYSRWLFLLCCAIAFGFGLWPLLIFYLFASCHRALKLVRVSKRPAWFIKFLIARIAQDFLFWVYFIFFYPKAKKEDYKLFTDII